MAKFEFTPLVPAGSVYTARLGAGTVAAATELDDDDIGKFLKLTGLTAELPASGSRYDVCAAGDPIEAQLLSVEPYTADGYAIGSIQTDGRVKVTLDGSEANGTGTIGIGDYVVCGTVADLTVSTYPKVRVATNQPDTVPPSTVPSSNSVGDIKIAADLSLAILADAMANAMFAWRVVHIFTTGVVGQLAIIERVHV